MTRDELKTRVDQIIKVGAHDDEAAHAVEDVLHRELIATYCPKWVVAEVDRLSAADFDRWCA